MWSDYNSNDALAYPYENVHRIEPTNHDEDVLETRSLSRLIASIHRFGQLILTDRVLDADDDRLQAIPVSLVVRLCGEELDPSDVPHLVGIPINHNPRITTFDLSLIETLPCEEWQGKVPDLSKYSEVIFYKVMSRNKSVVLRMSIDNRKEPYHDVDVDGYFLGDMTCTEVEPYRAIVHQLIFMFIPDTSGFQFNRRLHVPPTFCMDNVFMTYLFVRHLQFHGDYLELSNQYVLRMKLDVPYTTRLLELHDEYHGQLKIDLIDQKSHPFLNYEYKGKDDLEVLEDMGWYPVDVEGDGNCGFYVFLLGLENKGIKDFYKDTRREPRAKMSQNIVWAEVLYELRTAMSDHSAHMLTYIYRKGERNYEEMMWWIANVFDDEQVEGYRDKKRKYHRGLSECLAPKDLTPQHYVGFRFKKMSECHMNVYWGPHVLASMFKLRVIVVVRDEQGTESTAAKSTSKETDSVEIQEGDSSKGKIPKKYTWSIMSFEYKNETHSADAPHVELIWKTELDTPEKIAEARLSDIEFNRVPTIEVLYMHKPDGGHFQFLRRVLCAGLQNPPNEDKTVLREIIRDQRGIESWKMSVGAVANNNAIVAILRENNEGTMDVAINNNEVIPGNDEATTMDVNASNKELTRNNEEGTMVAANNNATNNNEVVVPGNDEGTTDAVDENSRLLPRNNADGTSNEEVTNDAEGTMAVTYNNDGVVPRNNEGTMDVATTNDEVIPGNDEGTMDVNTNNEVLPRNHEGRMGIRNNEEVVPGHDRGTMDVANNLQVPGNNEEGQMDVANNNEVIARNNEEGNIDVGHNDEVMTGNDDQGDNTTKNREEIEGRDKTQEMTRSKRVHNAITIPSKIPVSRKNSRAEKKRRVELAQQTKAFNVMCNNGEMPATRMMYESRTDRYYIYNVVAKSPHESSHVPIRRTEVHPNYLHQYNDKLVAWATQNPNRWVGPTVEDANVGTGDAPMELCTKRVCLYQQHNNPYCIVYSFASALWYCGLHDGAIWMHDAAPQFADMNDIDEQIDHLLSLTKNVVPLIGQPTVYGVRTNRHDHKLRGMDWNVLFEFPTRYPTIVIPILPNGRCTHAFCVVDDLIFDSTNPCALKLCMDSVRWLFRECEPAISRAYRFNHKYSPENCKVRGRYKHKMQKNW